MTHAELLLEDRRYHDALQTLGRLHDKHTAALRLELKAQQQAKNWDQVLSLLPQLEKRKVLEPSLLEQVRRYAQTENLKRKAIDSKSLREYWERLPTEQQREPRIAAAAAQGFVALGRVQRRACDRRAKSRRGVGSVFTAAVRRVPAARCTAPSGARGGLAQAASW